MKDKPGIRNAQPKDVIRTFVCIEIPESIKNRIARLEDSLRQTDAQVSWTRTSSIHLTLKFLGGVAATRIVDVSGAIERAANGINSFEIEIGGTGCFPNARNPRVLWVGVSKIAEELLRLYLNIEDQLEREGFEKEKRKFSPHLTIGRLRTPRNAAQLAERLLNNDFENETFTATQVIVMRSDLNPKGSIYTPQAVIQLTAS